MRKVLSTSSPAGAGSYAPGNKSLPDHCRRRITVRTTGIAATGSSGRKTVRRRQEQPRRRLTGRCHRGRRGI